VASESLDDYPAVLRLADVIEEERHEGCVRLPPERFGPVEVLSRELDGPFDQLLVSVLLGQTLGGDGGGVEAEIRRRDDAPLVGQRRGSPTLDHFGVRRESREVFPDRTDVHAPVLAGKPGEILPGAPGEPGRAAPVAVVRVVDRRRVLDEAVQEPLVVGSGLEFEPAVLPGVVGGVEGPRVEDGDPGTQVALHTTFRRRTLKRPL
jgi:hypothetical protein